jgi:glycosyltransferase involved in cell wall biosynthesis
VGLEVKESSSNHLKPSVSVIVPVYNGASTIEACLGSLLQQNYPANSYEIIIIENGSTDNTTELVEKYPVRLFHNDTRGPAPARNLGVDKSKAEIVAFTDADCIADPNWIHELVKHYNNPDVGGVGGAILAYPHAHRNAVEMFSDEYSPLINYLSGEYEFLPHLYTANASYRHHLLNEIGGFNIHLITGEDVDMAWRLQLQTGCNLCYAPKAIVYHHHRATRRGLSRQYYQYGFGEILLDTMYSRYPKYPRNLRFQMRRMLSQLTALPRYALSAGLRQIHLATGQATRYEASWPLLCFLVESNNLRGKLAGLIVTRFMRDIRPVFKMDKDKLIKHFYGGTTNGK